MMLNFVYFLSSIQETLLNSILSCNLSVDSLWIVSIFKISHLQIQFYFFSHCRLYVMYGVQTLYCIKFGAIEGFEK